MEVEIRIRITDEEGRYLENRSTYSNKRVDSLKTMLLRTTIAQLPGEVEALFSEAENPETKWISDAPEKDKEPKPKSTPKKQTAKK